MTEAETSYRTSVQQEAEAFAQQLREEVAFQANSTAQAQSLLSAERQQYDKNLKEQTERWQGSLDLVVEGATEELQEYKAENQELIAELNQAQQDLWDWEDYYQQQPPAPDPFAETNELFASFNEQDASANKPLPPPAPLTPAVLQAPQLQSQLSGFAFTRQAREAQARASELEQELPAAEQQELQAEAATATQQWAAHRDAELREALERSSFLRAISKPELRERRQLSRLLGYIPQVRQ